MSQRATATEFKTASWTAAALPATSASSYSAPVPASAASVTAAARPSGTSSTWDPLGGCTRCHETVTWKPVPGWESHAVSSDGQVRREEAGKGPARKGLVLWQELVRASGRPRVVLSANGQSFRTKVHRLVALAHLGPAPDGKPLVLHRDGDPRHSCVSNLYWGDWSDNYRDAVRHGTAPRGEAAGSSRLTTEQVLDIKRQIAEGKRPRALAAAFGVHRSTVEDIQRGRSWAWLAAPVPEGDSFDRFNVPDRYTPTAEAAH